MYILYIETKAKNKNKNNLLKKELDNRMHSAINKQSTIIKYEPNLTPKSGETKYVTR